MPEKRKHHLIPVDGLSEFRIEQIGALLHEYRRETFLSLEDFAWEHNFSRSFLERVENGKLVHFHTYLRLINIYGISVWQFFEGIE